MRREKRDRHLCCKGKGGPVRVDAATLLEDLDGGLVVVDDDDGLAEDSDGADGPVEVLVLAPVHPFLRARRREVRDVADEGEALRARGQWQARRGLEGEGGEEGGGGEEALEDVQCEAAYGEVCEEIEASHVERRMCMFPEDQPEGVFIRRRAGQQ